MKMSFFKVTILIGLLASLLVGCHGSGSNQPETTNAAPQGFDQAQTRPAEEQPEAGGAGNGQSGEDLPRRGEDFKQVRQDRPDTAAAIKVPTQIIKNANVRYRVLDYKKATADIGAAVKNHQGYVSEANENNGGYQVESHLVIRVPSKNFDILLAELLKIGSYINSNNVTAQDVTEEYVDIMARLRTKREVERRYVELLRQAKNVTEVLEVEAQLRVIREEIESRQGRLKYLQDQVGYSTIALDYYQPISTYAPEPKPAFFGRIGEAFGGGWDGLLDFTVGLFYTWPFLLISGAIIWLVRRWWKRRKK